MSVFAIQFLSLIIVVIICCYFIINVETVPNCTQIQRSFKEFISRKKRFVIYPDGSAVAATMSFTKTIVPKSPLGAFVIAEADFYYPLPNDPSNWNYRKYLPFPLHDKSFVVKEMSSSMSATAITTTTTDNYQQIVNHPGEINLIQMSNSNKDSNIPLAEYDGIDKNWNRNNYDWPDNSIRMDDTQQYNQHRWRNKFYNNGVPWTNLNHHQWRPPLQLSDYSMYNVPKSRNRYNPDLEHKDSYYMSQVRPDDSMNFEKNFNRDHTDWAKFHGHRQRKDIFEHFEIIAKQNGFDLKACLQRLICETQHYLLPPGISFFQDVLRILFTMPLRDVNDSYSMAMRSDKMDCKLIYGQDCKYSILGYLLHQQNRQNFTY